MIPSFAPERDENTPRPATKSCARALPRCPRSGVQRRRLSTRPPFVAPAVPCSLRWRIPTAYCCVHAIMIPATSTPSVPKVDNHNPKKHMTRMHDTVQEQSSSEFAFAEIPRLRHVLAPLPVRTAHAYEIFFPALPDATLHLERHRDTAGVEETA
ncbi:hypothetical protein BC628DRAFT_425037 [Trametes gibbosa]|nr:hypothetical protein BC628DRAFT_425037 [Trametes gibbosa]